MGAASIDIKIALAAREAAAELRALTTQLDAVETAEGEVESAGKIMARALSKAATDIEADLKESATAADALGSALGPELAAQVGRSGLEGFVATLRKAGLTAQEIEADADQLAGAIKHLDDVGQQMTGVQTGLKRVSTELDDTHMKATQNRSVFANWAGNTAQEMPGMANAFGPLGMALGQTVEYAAEGNINFKKMLGAGLAMAAVSVVVMEITSEISKQKKLQEESNKRVEEYSKAIREGRDSIDDLARAAENAGGKIVGFTGTLGETEDITDDLAKLGMTAGQFFELVKGGMPAIGDWAAKLNEAGISTEEFEGVAKAAAVATGEYDQAMKNAAAQARVFGPTQETLKRVTDDVTKAQGDARDAADELRDAQEELRRTQLDAIADSHDYEEAVLDLESSYADLEDQLYANNLAQMDATKGDREKEQSARDLKGAEFDLAGQIYDTSQKYAESKGAVEGSKQAIDLQIESLKASKEQFPELAALIDEYIAKLRSVPTDISTTFNAHGDAPSQRTGPRADGGSTGTGGRFRVGERGPEEVNLPAGGWVTPADQTPDRGNTTIYQLLPHGTQLDALTVAATRRRNRRNGFT